MPVTFSKRVADDLGQYRHWKPYLHDLGECEVKHGRVGIVNLYPDEAGNPELQEKFRQAKAKSGSNADLTALAEGLTEEIVTGLSRFSYLKVISRSSTALEFRRCRRRGLKLRPVIIAPALRGQSIRESN